MFFHTPSTFYRSVHCWQVNIPLKLKVKWIALTPHPNRSWCGSLFHYNLSFANCESWLVKNSAPHNCRHVLCCCDCIFNFKVDKRVACRIAVCWLGQCFCFARLSAFRAFSCRYPQAYTSDPDRRFVFSNIYGEIIFV